jgi:hypothetical protein
MQFRLRLFVPSDNTRMPIQVHSGLTDDNDFIALVGAIVNGLLTKESPEQIWIVQVDNWFDHKWLRFSGSGAVGNWMFAGVISNSIFPNRFDSVKTQFFQQKATFPPFSPGRIVGQWSFLRSGDDYVEFPFPTMPHDTEKAHSGSNLPRRIEGFTKSARFIWYSGNTLANGRGSLMVYNILNSQVVCWFAEFQRNRVWALKRTKGIAREEILQFIGGS